MSVFPGAAICIAIIGLNLFADGLNEIADPRSARGMENQIQPPSNNGSYKATTSFSRLRTSKSISV